MKKLAIYLVLTLLSSVGVFWALNGAWEPGSISHDYTWSIVGYLGIDIYAATVFLIGFLLGLLLPLLVVDRYKRIPALLLTISGILGAILTMYLGRWEETGRILNSIFPFLFIGAGGGFLFALPGISERKLRWSSLSLFVFSALAIVIGLIDKHIVLESPGSISALADLGVSTLFLSTFYKLVKYEDTVQVSIVGPEESGRTSLMFGIYSYVAGLGSDYKQVEPSWYDKYTDFIEGPKEYFENEDNPNYERFYLSLVTQDIFPYHINIKSSEYDGKLFPRVINTAINKLENRSIFSHVFSSGTEHINEDELTEQETVDKVSDEIVSSDILILLIPMKEVVDKGVIDNEVDDPQAAGINTEEIRESSSSRDYMGYLDEYETLINIYEGDILVVPTQCHILKKPYRLNNNDNIGPCYPDSNYHYVEKEGNLTFRQYVQEMLLQHSNADMNILSNPVYPYYYEYNDQTGDIETVGAEQIIKRISG